MEGFEEKLGAKLGSPDGFYADGLSVSNEQFDCLVLTDVDLLPYPLPRFWQ